MIKLSDYVIQYLEELGITHVFMLAGGGAMHLVDSLGKSQHIRHVCNLHEQACAIAADAYAQYTGRLGVALVTTGPGGTNTLTGVAASWLDSIPVLILSGQVKRADRMTGRGVRQMGFQEVDIVRLVRPITKYAVTVMDPESIRFHLEKAVFTATSRRPGPVWIDIPLDVQAARIHEDRLPRFEPPKKVTGDSSTLKRKVRRCLELLRHARRPVILAGNGIRLAGAVDLFHFFLDHVAIPVLTTWKAADLISEDHPLYVGRPGAVGQRGANFVQQNADWILCLGARLDLGQTAYNHQNFAPKAHRIMVDVDRAEIRKMQTHIHVPIWSDAGDFLREFLRQSTSAVSKDHTPWLAQCKEWHRRYPVVLPEYWKETQYINDYVLISVLSDELTGQDLLIPGSSGACSERTMQAIRIKPGLRVFNSQGLGSMGFGIPATIGGCLASGGKRTICLEGDGGFVMNIQELETVRRLQLPIKFFVLNNGGYGSIRATQKSHFNGHLVGCTPASGLTLPNISALAESFGIPSVRLDTHATIRDQVRRVLKTPGPVVCEVIVSPDQPTAPRVVTQQREDGSIVSSPMEDLWPFLDKQELQANMNVGRRDDSGLTSTSKDKPC
ncbi:thiamine pyrophosphate-binding protein [Desulfosoma sp.]